MEEELDFEKPLIQKAAHSLTYLDLKLEEELMGNWKISAKWTYVVCFTSNLIFMTGMLLFTEKGKVSQLIKVLLTSFITFYLISPKSLDQLIKIVYDSAC